MNDNNLIPVSRENIGKSFKNIFVIFKDAYQNIPFRKLCIATFLVFNSFQTIAAFSFFIIVHYLFLGDASAASPWPTLHGSVGAIVTTFIVIPIVSKMAQKYGKKETFIISQGLKKARDQVRLSLQQAAQITPIRVQNIELTENPEEKALYIVFTILDFPLESIPPEVNVSTLPPEVTILLPGAVNNLKSVVESGNLKIELPQTTGVSG